MLPDGNVLRVYKNDKVEQTHGYRVLNRIGDGTYAKVFLTELMDPEDDQTPIQKLACKVIDTLLSPKEYVIKFLPRELDILRKLNHPHIVQVHSIYRKGHKYLIFMRYAENGDLLDFIITSGPIAENQARMWMKQISLAMEYLHELEIAHRDIKCENVLITANYNAKLADFGFARHTFNERGVQTLSKTYCGSTSYLAPEIIKAVPYDPKMSDMWSLGVVIFVMLNKCMPFQNDSIVKQYYSQINRKWKFRPERESEISEEVKELITRLLEPHPQDRCTINEFINSDWMLMDPRLVGMTKEETQALINARKERKLMKKSFFVPKH